MSVVLLQIIPGVSRTMEFVILFALASAGSTFLIGLLFRQIRRYGAYAYANARVNAMKGSLFRDEELDPLVQSQNIQNLISLLEDSPYSPYMESIEKITPHKVEKSLQKHLIDSHDKISKLAPEEIRPVFQEMTKIHEIENIKTIFVGKYVKMSRERIEDELLPQRSLSEELYEKAIETESIEDAAMTFEDTEYWDEINEGLTEAEDSGNLLALWLGLEQRHWKKIWKTARDSEVKHTEIVQRGIGMKIDIYNILTAIRCKAEAVPPEDIKELIIPIYTELDSKVLERGIDSDDVTEATNILEDSTYGKPLSKARKEYEETGSIFPFERELKEFLLRKLRTLSIQHYTGVGPLLAFFQEKDTEVKNLTTILNGKAEGLESEEIKEKLVTPGVEI